MNSLRCPKLITATLLVTGLCSTQLCTQLCSTAFAQNRPDTLRREARTETVVSQLSRRAQSASEGPASKGRKKKRIPRTARKLRRLLGKNASRASKDYRTANGVGNNQDNSSWGSAGSVLMRRASRRYRDGKDAPNGTGRKSAREISNICADQSFSHRNPQGISDFFWQWGQFLDHDIDLTPVLEPAQEFTIEIPFGDRFFDPNGTGLKEMSFERSAYTLVDGVREQMNDITAYIDASNVYGSDIDRMLELRRLDGSAKLKSSKGRLLPLNTNAFPNAPTADNNRLFLAGDFRANEQVGLTTMHTLFMREHNYWAKHLRRAFPDRAAYEIFQLARAIVSAEIQIITHQEFLPILLGDGALEPYTGYDASVDPSISNEFATAAYRFGHSMISPSLLRIEKNGRESEAGHLPLRSAFFRPDRLRTEGGIEPILRGLATQTAQAIDAHIIDDLRNFLFGPPGAGGFDLAALNIQRGRDHGLPDFNQIRVDFGLQAIREFSDINPDPAIYEELAVAYDSVNDIDPWVGGLSESPFAGGLVGETWHQIIKDQFERLRDGDRFWYSNYLPLKLQRFLEDQTLAKIIRRNTKISKELQDNVFFVKGAGGN